MPQVSDFSINPQNFFCRLIFSASSHMVLQMANRRDAFGTHHVRSVQLANVCDQCLQVILLQIDRGHTSGAHVAVRCA
jgi:hypothetical protein